MIRHLQSYFGLPPARAARRRLLTWALGSGCHYRPRMMLQGADCLTCGREQAAHWPAWRRALDWMGLEVGHG